MYKIEKKIFGYKLTFNGVMDAKEMKQWLEESKKALANEKGAFGVFVDMRTLKPLTDDAQKIMVQGQQLYKNTGMKRSVVILENALIQLQFKRLAKDSGIYEWERYLSAADTPNWEQVGTDWITRGVDPDKHS